MAELEYEKVKVGEFIEGIISKVQEEKEHSFKGFEGAPDKICEAVRFVFIFDEYNFPHYSRWEKKNFGSKSNLYKKYIEKLVENPEQNKEFDLTLLENLPVKVLWSEKGNWQNIEMILPLAQKIKIEGE